MVSETGPSCLCTPGEKTPLALGPWRLQIWYIKASLQTNINADEAPAYHNLFPSLFAYSLDGWRMRVRLSAGSWFCTGRLRSQSTWRRRGFTCPTMLYKMIAEEWNRSKTWSRSEQESNFRKCQCANYTVTVEQISFLIIVHGLLSFSCQFVLYLYNKFVYI